MKTYRKRIGEVAASLGAVLALVLLATCESPLLMDIREASDEARTTGISYKITFDANGAEGTMSRQSVQYGQTVILNPNAFTRTGYGFAGWALESDGIVAYSNSAEYTHSVEQDVTLYAQWTAGQYTIFFNANDGSGSMDDQPVEYEQTVTLSANNGDITRIGYTFAGWAITNVGTIVYPDGSAYTHELENDRTLYAKWTANQYTVTFNPNNGTTPFPWSSKEVIYDSTYGTLPTTTRTGYTFAGWVTAEEVQITPATTVTITSNQTLYAQWTITSYTARYNADENGATSGAVPAASSYDYSAVVTVSSPTDLRGQFIGDGITQRFVEWNTQSNGGGTSYQPSETFAMPGHDVTLYAIFTTGTSRIGKTGPAGGFVFHDRGDYWIGWRYMEAAPASTEWQSKPWGGYGVTVGDGAQGTAIGTGAANTQAIVASYGEREPYASRADYAAKLCTDLDYGGSSDWFLPSWDELHKMYNNLHLEGIGGFASASYWSSSELDRWFASRHDFLDGYLHDNIKMFEYRVRAARVF